MSELSEENGPSKMRAAKVENSPRLQLVLSILEDGKEHSTRDIISASQAKILAVNSVISELRRNGYEIVCRQDKRTYYYKLMEKRSAGMHS